MPAVLIIDDNVLTRQGLRHMLGQEHRDLVFGQARSIVEAFPSLARRTWDIVLLDVGLNGQHGFQLLSAILSLYPTLKILMLSEHHDPRHALRANRLGASGYASKNSSRRDLLKVFQSVLAGEQQFVCLTEDQPLPPRPKPADLSSRERDVLMALGDGKRICEIAGELNLNDRTVSTYRRRILDKLGLRTTGDLVRYAVEENLIRPVSQNLGQ